MVLDTLFPVPWETWYLTTGDRTRDVEKSGTGVYTSPYEEVFLVRITTLAFLSRISEFTMLNEEVRLPTDETDTVERSSKFERNEVIVVGEGGIEKIAIRDVAGLSNGCMSKRIQVEIMVPSSAIDAAGGSHLLGSHDLAVGIIQKPVVLSLKP